MEKGLYQNLRKFISVIDSLRDVGLQKHIKLPRIVTLGTQSSGKSSLLESIVGMDFLPRGEGVCTRRPLELRLIHVQETSSHPPAYGEFEQIPNKKFTNFDEIKRNIEMLTDKVAGTKKGIIDDPIVLTIHSEACPDLTLVDLPGITRIPLKDSDQPENIEEITMQMAHRYVKDERTIILCVIPANQDLSTSDALKMAKQIDPKGQRTLGVLTKIDIMDQGSNARNILANKEIPLRLGYVGVKNRNQQDIKDNKKVSQALKDEKLYFSKHPVYSTLPPGILGTEVLTQKLSNQLFDHIRRHLPDIMKEMNIKLEECQERLKLLGPPLPHNDAEKTQLIWDIVTRFSLQFRNSIEGKYSTDANLSLSQPEGAKIRIMFNDIFQDFLPDSFTASKEYDDKDISKAIKKHEGDSLPGFYGQDAFLYLLDPILDRLKEPSQECVNEIFILLEKMSNELLSKECQRFPTLLTEMQEIVVKILDCEREKTKQIVDDVIDSETGYLFTSDQSFFKNFFENAELAPKPAPKQGQPQPQPEILTEEKVRSLIIKEMRNKIDIYFKIVVRNLRDRIPKTIGYFFIKKLQQADVKEERERLQSTISVLKNSQKVIKRDPDLQNFIYASKMNEVNEEIPEEQNISHKHNASGPSIQPNQRQQQMAQQQKQQMTNQNPNLQQPINQNQAKPMSSNPAINQPTNQMNQQRQPQPQQQQQQQSYQQGPSQPISQARVPAPAQQQQQVRAPPPAQQQQPQQHQIQQSQSGKILGPQSSSQQTPQSTNTSTPRTQQQQHAQQSQQQQPSQNPQFPPQQKTNQPQQQSNMFAQQPQQSQQQVQQQQQQLAQQAASAQRKPNFFQQGAADQKNPLGGGATGVSPQAQAQAQLAQQAVQEQKKKEEKKAPKKTNLFG